MTQHELEHCTNEELDGPPSTRAATLPPRAPESDDAPPPTSRRAMMLGLGSIAAAAWLARSTAREAPPSLGTAIAASMPRAPAVGEARPSEMGPSVLPWPARRAGAPTGSAFARQLREIGGYEREAIIGSELAAGNVPDFLRRFVAVPLVATDAPGSTDGAASGRQREAVVFVLPDYLAIGTDQDFLRVPMMPATAQAIADRLGCVMPTRLLVDVIYRQAQVKLTPAPLDSGPEMITTDEFAHHNAAIEEQRRERGGALGALTAGHKKDVVISPRLFMRRNRVAIYGMHRRDGTPIQALSLLHQANYVDYAHGVRLLAGEMIVEGRLRRVADVFADGALCGWLSDEGPLEAPRYPRRS